MLLIYKSAINNSSLNYIDENISYSKMNFITYIIIIIIMFLCSLILCYYYNTKESITSSVTIILANMFFYLSVYDSEVKDIYSNIDQNNIELKNNLFIQHSLKEISYMLRFMDYNNFSKETNDLNEFIINTISKNDFLSILEILNIILNKLKNSNYNDELLLKYKNKLIISVNNIINSLSNSSFIMDFIPIQMISISDDYNKNDFFESNLNIEDLYKYIKRYNYKKENEIDYKSIFNNLQGENIDKFEIIKSNNENNAFYKIIYENYSIYLVCNLNNNIKNIYIEKNDMYYYHIDFINDFPLYSIDNLMYIIMQDCSLNINNDNNNNYVINNIILSSTIVFNSIFKHNQYIDIDFSISFNKDVINIKFNNNPKQLNIFINESININ